MRLLTPFAIETPEETRRRKLLFAEALLKNPGDPFAVALQIVQGTGDALRAAQEWPADFEVIEHQQKLIAELGEAAFLPNEVESARLAYDMATGKQLAIQERINALELYGKLRGFIQKSGTIINNNNVQVNRVMVVKDHGTDEEWEAKAKRQQARLRHEVIEHDSDSIAI